MLKKARGTEQNRGGSSWLPQAKAALAAGTLAAENISIGESLRGPPILIQIPILNSLEVTIPYVRYRPEGNILNQDAI